MDEAQAKEAEADMAVGALDAIRRLLDEGGIPRGTFGDDQVRNLVALYNQRGDKIDRLRDRLSDIAYLADHASPCGPGTWEGFAQFMGRIARRALASPERANGGGDD